MSSDRTIRYGILVAAICFMVFFTGTYAQFQLSPMAGQVMQLFQINEQQYAMIFTACMLPALVLSLLSGTLCDRFGTKVTVGVALTLSAVGIVGRLMTTSFPIVLACMVVLGLGCMILTSTVAKILAPYFCGEKLNVAVGIVSSSNTIAMFIAMATTALLPSLRFAFSISAVFAVGVLVAWVVCVKKDVPESSTSSAASVESAAMREALRVCLRNRHVWCAGITLAAMMIGQMAIATFLPTALQTVKGFSQESAGAISSVYMLGAIVGSVVYPKLFNTVRAKRVFASASMLIVAAGVAFAWNIPNFVVMCIALFVCGCLLSGLVPLLYALPVSLPDIGMRYAGAAGGLSATIQTFGLSVIPTYVLVPLFTSSAGLDFNGLFLASGAIVMVGLVAINLTPLARSGDTRDGR